MGLSWQIRWGRRSSSILTPTSNFVRSADRFRAARVTLNYNAGKKDLTLGIVNSNKGFQLMMETRRVIGAMQRKKVACSWNDKQALNVLPSCLKLWLSWLSF